MLLAFAELFEVQKASIRRQIYRYNARITLHSQTERIKGECGTGILWPDAPPASSAGTRETLTIRNISTAAYASSIL
jgi:hypothetical protein